MIKLFLAGVIVIVLILILKALNNSGEKFTVNNKFCVIVTTYNPGSSYIDKCLKMIENQTYKNFDVCILDDASTIDKEDLYFVIDDYCKRNNWKFGLMVRDITTTYNIWNINSEEFDKIKNHPLLSIIGHACDLGGGCQLINGLGQQIELTAQGWQSFDEA